MADAKDEGCWTNHAKEHEIIKEYAITEDAPLRKMVLSLEGVKTVVDLGCGSGLIRHLFDGYNYIGVDQNEAMIAVARKRFPNDTFHVCNGRKLEVLGDASVDLFFTSAVLQHNLHNEKTEVVKEIVRVLRPGGYYLATENTFREDNYGTVFPRTLYADDLTDGYSFTPKGWENYMAPLGLRMIEYQKPSEYIYVRD